MPSSPATDIRKTHDELVARGIGFSQPPVEMFFGWWAVFNDPEGNRIALNRSKEKS